MTKKSAAMKLQKTWNAYRREMRMDLENILRDADMWYSPDGESIPKGRNASGLTRGMAFPTLGELETGLMTRAEIKTAYAVTMGAKGE